MKFCQARNVKSNVYKSHEVYRERILKPKYNTIFDENGTELKHPVDLQATLKITAPAAIYRIFPKLLENISQTISKGNIVHVTQKWKLTRCTILQLNGTFGATSVLMVISKHQTNVSRRDFNGLVVGNKYHYLMYLKLYYLDKLRCWNNKKTM